MEIKKKRQFMEASDPQTNAATKEGSGLKKGPKQRGEENLSQREKIRASKKGGFIAPTICKKAVFN